MSRDVMIRWRLFFLSVKRDPLNDAKLCDRFSKLSCNFVDKKKRPEKFETLFCGNCWGRTSDLLLVRQAL